MHVHPSSAVRRSVSSLAVNLYSWTLVTVLDPGSALLLNYLERRARDGGIVVESCSPHLPQAVIGHLFSILPGRPLDKEAPEGRPQRPACRKRVHEYRS